MAAMPSVGRIKQLSVAGVVAAAFLGVSPRARSAGDVWLWACHGPNGQALTEPAPGRPGQTRRGQRSAAAARVRRRGARRRLHAQAAPPATAASSLVRSRCPTGLRAKAVMVNRDAARLRAAATGAQLPRRRGRRRRSRPAPLAGDGRAPGHRRRPRASTLDVQLQLGLRRRAPRSTSSASRSWSRDDDGSERSASSWNTPRRPHDGGHAGLHRLRRRPGPRRAHASAAGPRRPSTSTPDNVPRALARRRDDRPSARRRRLPQRRASATNLPLKALTAPIVAWTDAGAGRSPATVWLDDRARLPDGLYPWTVTVYDSAGNAARAQQHRRGLAPGRADRHPHAETSRRHRHRAGATTQQPATTPAGGGVAGAQAQPVPLAAPVGLPGEAAARLQGRPGPASTSKAYRFTGRLTCVINGKRRSAPKRTRSRLLNKVGKRTVRSPARPIRDQGRGRRQAGLREHADGDLPLHQQRTVSVRRSGSRSASPRRSGKAPERAPGRGRKL